MAVVKDILGFNVIEKALKWNFELFLELLTGQKWILYGHIGVFLHKNYLKLVQ